MICKCSYQPPKGKDGQCPCGRSRHTWLDCRDHPDWDGAAHQLWHQRNKVPMIGGHQMGKSGFQVYRREG